MSTPMGEELVVQATQAIVGEVRPADDYEYDQCARAARVVLAAVAPQIREDAYDDGCRDGSIQGVNLLEQGKREALERIKARIEALPVRGAQAATFAYRERVLRVVGEEQPQELAAGTRAVAGTESDPWEGRKPASQTGMLAADPAASANMEHREAALAWERWNPALVSDPKSDTLRSAWIGGYLAALQRDTLAERQNAGRRVGEEQPRA